jgi:nitrite reductase/ring-hydroxylating ferredoxin subunit
MQRLSPFTCKESHTMVKHTGVTPMRASDIPPGTCKLGHVNNKEVAIFNIDGKFYATQNECTHRSGPLCEGGIWGEIVTCPWHGSEFNVRTGEVVTDPAETPIATYKVEVKDDLLVIDEA